MRQFSLKSPYNHHQPQAQNKETPKNQHADDYFDKHGVQAYTLI